MKLLIAGSRSIEKFDLSPYIPPETDLIISGGANGIDCLAEEYADKYHISKLIVFPNYKKYSRAAPLRRNEEMVNTADKLLIIWDGASTGTSYTLKYAKKLHKPICLITKSSLGIEISEFK